jgi:hypothetical protein
MPDELPAGVDGQSGEEMYSVMEFSVSSFVNGTNAMNASSAANTESMNYLKSELIVTPADEQYLSESLTSYSPSESEFGNKHGEFISSIDDATAEI